MTREEAKAFIASVPWRAVQICGDHPPDPHEYVIKEWNEVDTEQFDAFVQLIKAEGYRGKYRRPHWDRFQYNDYLRVEEWIYWYIFPRMLNRERADHRTHEPIAK